LARKVIGIDNRAGREPAVQDGLGAPCLMVGRISDQDFFQAAALFRRIVGDLAQPPPGIDVDVLRGVSPQNPLQEEAGFLVGLSFCRGDPADEEVTNTVRIGHQA
jgi:hypothetical protein